MNHECKATIGPTGLKVAAPCEFIITAARGTFCALAHAKASPSAASRRMSRRADSSLYAASPARAEAAMMAITCVGQRNRAANAAMPISAAVQANGPDQPCGQ